MTILNRGEPVARRAIEDLLAGREGPVQLLSLEGDAPRSLARIEPCPWVWGIDVCACGTAAAAAARSALVTWQGCVRGRTSSQSAGRLSSCHKTMARQCSKRMGKPFAHSVADVVRTARTGGRREASERGRCSALAEDRYCSDVQHPPWGGVERTAPR